jgi:hypothetical protein
LDKKIRKFEAEALKPKQFRHIKSCGNIFMEAHGGPTSGGSIRPSFLKNTQGNALLIAVVVIAVLCALGGLIYVFPSASNQGYSPEQPIPYSHKLHAGDMKIPCLYCHVGAEKSWHATVPALNVCMNCHRVVKTDSPWIKKIKKHYDEGTPIQWVRVHELPEHVHFPHYRHVNAGLKCQTCHGPVQEMERVYQYAPLNMGWCLDCHRGKTTPRDIKAKFYPSKDHPNWQKGQVATIDCSACHF